MMRNQLARIERLEAAAVAPDPVRVVRHIVERDGTFDPWRAAVGAVVIARRPDETAEAFEARALLDLPESGRVIFWSDHARLGKAA